MKEEEEKSKKPKERKKWKWRKKKKKTKKSEKEPSKLYFSFTCFTFRSHSGQFCTDVSKINVCVDSLTMVLEGRGERGFRVHCLFRTVLIKR